MININHEKVFFVLDEMSDDGIMAVIWKKICTNLIMIKMVKCRLRSICLMIALIFSPSASINSLVLMVIHKVVQNSAFIHRILIPLKRHKCITYALLIPQNIMKA